MQQNINLFFRFRNLRVDIGNLLNYIKVVPEKERKEVSKVGKE